MHTTTKNLVPRVVHEHKVTNTLVTVENILTQGNKNHDLCCVGFQQPELTSKSDFRLHSII